VPTNNRQRAGIRRERELKARYESKGWTVIRSAGSKGAGDLVCGKAGYQTQVIECKTTAAGPFTGWSPSERSRFADDADRAGWLPVLVWWPYDRQGPRFYPGKDSWPDGR
jgi:Holliday junction resolvase